MPKPSRVHFKGYFFNAYWMAFLNTEGLLCPQYLIAKRWPNANMQEV